MIKAEAGRSWVRFSLLESTLLVANFAAALNLWLVLMPRWGEICRIAHNLFEVSR